MCSTNLPTMRYNAVMIAVNRNSARTYITKFVS